VENIICSALQTATDPFLSFEPRHQSDHIQTVSGPWATMVHKDGVTIDLTPMCTFSSKQASCKKTATLCFESPGMGLIGDEGAVEKYMVRFRMLESALRHHFFMVLPNVVQIGCSFGMLQIFLAYAESIGLCHKNLALPLLTRPLDETAIISSSVDHHNS